MKNGKKGFQCLLDPELRIFIVKYVNRYLAVPATKTAKPEIWFGDGSQHTAGKVYLKQLSIGTIENNLLSESVTEK